MKSKVIKALISCVIAVGVIGGGYYGYKTVFAAKQVTAPAARTMSVAARKMSLQVNVQGTGAAYSASTKDVIPSNVGTLKDISVKVGDTVTAGQKLFSSDSDDVRQAVTTAQSNLNDANLNLTSAQNQLTADQNDLASAQAAAAAPAQSTNTSNGGSTQGNSNQGTKSVDALKLQVQKDTAALEQAKLKVAAAKDKLTIANAQVGKMAVTAPIGGVVTAVNFTNGDSLQQNKAVLTIVDMSAIKVKVAVDELDIEKIKLGQKAQIKFDAIKGKTFEGAVELIAQDGKSTNNVTTYDVVVGITNPEGIKLGMNANVNISIDSKDNALVIPAEAVFDMNGKKYVRVEAAGSSSETQGTGNSSDNNQMNGNSQGGSNRQSNPSNQNNKNSSGNATKAAKQAARGTQQTSTNTYSAAQTANVGRPIEIKIGLENENYVEVLEGLTEGQKVIIVLPQASTTTNQNQNRNAMGGFGGAAARGGFPRD